MRHRFAPFVLIGMLAAGSAAADDYPVGDAGSMWADPYMIGSYRHWDEIYPVREVPNDARVSPLPAGAPLTIESFAMGGREIALSDYVARARTTGLIVLKDGEIRFEGYWHGAGAADRMTSMSVAKSVVSTLIGFALADGLIRDLADPISDYVPALKGSGYDGVPIEAVLQMSSGIDFVEDYDNSSDSEELWLETVHFRKTALPDYVARMTRGEEPYTRFNYKGVDTAALAMLLRAVTGKDLATYLSEKLWQPLGMESAADWGLDGRGAAANEIAFCCLNAVLRDYARLGQFLLQEGAWNGAQLLPADWVARATRPSHPQVGFGKLYEGYRLGYQYQWWVLPGEDGAFTGQGVNGQFLYVNPAKNMVVVMTSVWREFWDNALERETYALFDAFAEALEN